MMSKLSVALNIICLALFAFMAYMARRFPFFPGDIAIGHAVERIDATPFRFIMEAVDAINIPVAWAVIVGLVVLRLWSRRRLDSVFIMLLVAFAILNPIVKTLIARPRANTELMVLVTVNSPSSFPSGHTLFVTLFYGFLFYLASVRIERAWVSWTVRGLLLLLIALTALSRIYFGAHWASDVLGGFLLGGLALAPAIVLHRRLESKSDLPGVPE